MIIREVFNAPYESSDAEFDEYFFLNCLAFILLSVCIRDCKLPGYLD